MPTNVAVRLDCWKAIKMLQTRFSVVRGGGERQVANLNRNDRVDSVDREILE